MNVNTPRLAALAFAGPAIVLLLSTTIDGRGKPDGIQLNLTAVEYAEQLLATGHVVCDSKGKWRADQPSAEQENEFCRARGFAEYAKWHLGIDERHAENSKARYKFPYGDFQNVHRCGLLAVKSRAQQYGHMDIEVAAEKLLNEKPLKPPRR